MGKFLDGVGDWLITGEMAVDPSALDSPLEGERDHPDVAVGADPTGVPPDQAHARLFAHVGVGDPHDWQAVALRLAERYVPNVLNDSVQKAHNPPPRRKPGRPGEWHEWRLIALAVLVENVLEASAAKRIRPDLTTDIAACKFIAAGKTLEAQYLRDSLGLRTGTTGETLRNRLPEARALMAPLKLGSNYRGSR